MREQRLKEEAEKREKKLLHLLEENESKKKALEAKVDKIIETEIVSFNHVNDEKYINMKPETLIKNFFPGVEC